MDIFKLNKWLESRNAISLRVRSTKSRATALRSVTKFNNNVPPQSKELYTVSFLERYENHLRRNGRALNTISSYISSLRAIYHAAVAEKHLNYTPKLFSTVFTGLAPTKKRALNTEGIYKLMTADLSEVPDLEYYRDKFVFSFCVQGMAYVDLAYLRKSDIKDGMLAYRRRKSRSMIRVPLTIEAKELIEKYSAQTPNSPYVFPIINPDEGDERTQYESNLRTYNRKLKQLAAYLGIEENLSSYVARHSWATTAYRNDVSMSVVSQAMGHHTEAVTRIYLGSLDTTALSKANETVMNAIMGNARKKAQSKEPQKMPKESINSNEPSHNKEKKTKRETKEALAEASPTHINTIKRDEEAIALESNTQRKKKKNKKKAIKWTERQKHRRHQSKR